MSPREYRLGRRQAGAAATRSRIIQATRGLLAAGDLSELTIEAVSRHAGVARMTVYYQFGSKPGLLEALFDSLASHVGAPGLVTAIQRPDPERGLSEFIAAIAGFWSADRPIVRRLQGLAALDPDFHRVWRVRENLRRQGLRALAERLSAHHAGLAPLDEAADLLYALVAFETFDALAGEQRRLEEVAPLVERVARAALGLGPARVQVTDQA